MRFAKQTRIVVLGRLLRVAVQQGPWAGEGEVEIHDHRCTRERVVFGEEATWAVEEGGKFVVRPALEEGVGEVDHPDIVVCHHRDLGPSVRQPIFHRG
jgi:hypothetical protein